MKTCLSFGAGVQTTALLVLIATGRWPRPDAILFADTGNEHESTYRYLQEVSGPYARAHGLTVTVLGTDWRTPHYRSDLETYCKQHRMLPGTLSRWCTTTYKRVPLQHYRRRVLKATANNPVESWIGISTDESVRAARGKNDYGEIKRYPLIELGLNRSDCEDVIAAAGLAVPPKSGCWFCPFMKQSLWQQLKREDPERFARALAMERGASPNRTSGKPRYLPIFGSLERIAAQDELPGFDEAAEAEAGCVTGNCFV